MKRILWHLLLCSVLLSTGISAQSWETLAPIPESFTFPVVAVADGKIHVMGGGGVGGATDHHFAYNTATNTWASRANVPYRAQQPAGATANGKIHFFGGGFPNTGTPLNDHYIYDPASNSWEQAADLTAPRAIHYAVALDNTIFSLAGQGMTNLCQTYDSGSNSWTTQNNLPDNFFFYGAHVATQGHIYRFGGGGYSAPKNFAHRYDPGTDSWSAITVFPHANHGLRGAAIGNKIYLAGGYYDFLERPEVYVFDTDTEDYTAGVPLPLGRNYHSMVALDSCIYVVGGNHAIDQTVTFQLLRFCPFATTSSTVEKGIPLEVRARILSGRLILSLPENTQGVIQVSLYDLAGKQLLTEKRVTGSAELVEIWTGELPPSVYLVRVQGDKCIFSTKVVAD